MTNIPTIDIADGLTISRMVTGLWQIADMERNNRLLDRDLLVKCMQDYFQQEYTTFDMADHYGSAEIIAGQFRRGLINEYQKPQLLTKWVPTLEDREKEDVRDAIHLSMKRLGVEQIDLLQYHAWNYADPIWLDHLFWLMELQHEGLIAHLGLTNFDMPHLKLAVDSGIPIQSNQISFSLLDQRARRQMCDYCKVSGIKILAFGTLAGGFLSNKWMGRPEPSSGDLVTWSQMKYKRYIDALGGWDHFQDLLGILHSISQRHQVSIAQVAAKFVLDQQGVGAIIVGARLGESEHIDENKSVFEVILEEEDVNRLVEWHDQGNLPGNCGDEYRKPPYLTAKGDLSDHISGFPAPYPQTQNAFQRSICHTGTSWEELAGFSRAIKVGNRVLVSGTTSTHGSKVIGGKDPASQTHFIIDKIEGALQTLGAGLKDVVRTRIYVKDPNQWMPIAQAHGARFREVSPANTLIHADLIGSEYLVEIEAEALLVE